MVSALYLSGIAAWFSIVGILTLFSGAQTAALCMGVGIEVGKVIGVSWLYRSWETAKWTLKIPVLILCLVAMLVTSAGIFGFLSKAHFQQNIPMEKVSTQLKLIDQKIERQKNIIADSQNVIKQLDETIDVLLKNEKISAKGGARDVRALQKEERDTLNAKIEQSQSIIATLEEEKYNLSQTINNVKLEVEVISYLSTILYGEAGDNNTNKAVKIMIVLIMICFDPFAIILLMCGNHSLMQYYSNKQPKEKTLVKEETSPPEIELMSYTYTTNFNVGDDTTLYEVIDDQLLKREDQSIDKGVDKPIHNDHDVIQEQKSKEDKEVRLEKIKSKLKRGEIGWISSKK